MTDKTTLEDLVKQICDLAQGPSACPYCAAALHIQTDGSYLVSMCRNAACSSNEKDKP